MSLREIVKQRIITQVIKDAQSKMKKPYTVIVADDTTIKILHHCFKMHELNELDVGVVLNVKFNRERVKVSPIYFLSSNVDSAKMMCADYSNPKETKYAAPVHVYFNSKVSKKIIDLVKGENIRKYMKTFTEIQNDFLVLEQRVFSFYGGRTSFNDLYVNTQNRSDELAQRAQQLIGLCLALEEDPAIRYSTNGRDAKTFAELFNSSFNDTKSSLKQWSPNPQSSVLLILDRRDDPLTPFMHSLSFQPMVFDLLHDDILENGAKIRGLKEDGGGGGGDGNTRPMPDESDQIWIKYRHDFIGEVVQKLPKQFNDWQKENNVAQLKRKTKDKESSSNVKTKDLISAARDMPQYQKLVKQFTTNIGMASKVMNIFKNSSLRDVIQLEQDMATGIDEDAKKVDRTQMQKQFSELLVNENVDQQIKLRAFMLYVISQGGMKPEQRKTLLKQSNFDSDTEDVIVNLGALGVSLTAQKPGQQSGGNKTYWKKVAEIAKKKSETTSIIRHTSYLEWVLTSQLSEKLSEDDFKWINKPSASKKSGAPKSYRKHKKNQNDDENGLLAQGSGGAKGPRYIVYFLGGVSYEELKVCYEFSQQNDVDIFVGSTLIYSPQEYLQCFRKDDGVEEQKNDE
mmetsp:Transcript_18585/g.29497  ORF Transcript_18585/g.29497 Transcript_18585/m.29497 type:complete len:625 (+) Transcript_18585:61-1935(+)|eukprot:CAMPEP_0202697628 /NCGR_PEP_ID=MMETSP1385-20130828/10944_1 /ASSEMBLY_ACC=CAM_ASM_000861 /TAXON_ID=933848 /ORGANISM="Elphidium margaritaceum" /LENGTH=624 /DNA_ID=CAMNT_0049354129 /DNA_START=23 /DNA_END=1897 /DNA_ORIENTATION=+